MYGCQSIRVGYDSCRCRHVPLTPITRVGIVAKSHLRAATPHLVEIGDWLEARGIAAVFETDDRGADARRLRLAGRRQGRRWSTAVDMVLVLGGDGTLLGMADCIGEAGSAIPILGVNFGSLGFLTEVTLPELYPSLEAALDGRAQIEERLMLRVDDDRGDGGVRAAHIALNDVVITKTARSRMIDLSVSVGDEFVTRSRPTA